MTPEQMERFHLVNIQEPGVNTPGQVMHQGMPAESVEVDEVSEGLARGVSYMARNGPVRPVQKVPARMITRQQLEEQKMNEAAGLPSNLDEASRVVALEKKILNMSTNMDKILQLLSQPSNAPAMETPPKEVYTVPQGHLLQEQGLPPTPQASPDVQPSELESWNQEVWANQTVQTSTHPDQETGRPTPEVELRESPLGFSQQALQLPVSLETRTVTPEKFFGPTTVTLGPTGSRGPGPDEDRYELTEEVSPGEVVAVAEEPEPTPEDVVEMKRLSRQQMLTEQVSNWLKSKDTHKFWRQFLAGACNKNLSYNTWPPEFQGPFNDKFKAMVADPAFVSTLCGRITKMQMGHLVAPHVAGAFVVVTAGFLAFALLDQ